MKNKEIKPSELLLATPKHAEPNVEIPVSEYVRLKDIETRFEILKNEMIHSSYCAIHHQVILGIEHEYAQKNKELNADMFPGKWDPLKK